MNHPKALDSKIRAIIHRKYVTLIAVLVVFGVIGTVIVLSTRAATPLVNLEPENGTIIAPASAVADATASGSKSVRFGTATSSACTTFQGPLRITAGGTYTGCYQSTNSDTPAVEVATTQPVTLNRMEIRHAGVGVENGTSLTNLTITNTTFTAITPTAAGTEQQAVRLYQPATLVIEHNRMISGHGVQLNGDGITTNGLRISYNDYIDIGRLSQPDYYQGAIHFDKMTAPGGKIFWNRVTNHHGKSHGEDIIAMPASKGASGNPIQIQHNMVNGAYPISGDGAGYTGGAYDFADITGAYIEGDYNYAVNYTNNGFMIPTGTQVYHRHSLAVYDGIADDGQRVSSTFGAGFTTWWNDGYPRPNGVGVTDSRSAQRRWNGSAWERSDFYLPEGTNSGNTTLPNADAATEQAAINEFEQSVVANGVTIGPLP